MDINTGPQRPAIGETVVVTTQHDVPRYGQVVGHYGPNKFVLEGAPKTRPYLAVHHATTKDVRHDMYDTTHTGFLGWVTVY